jgi:predicted acetyltransferase
MSLELRPLRVDDEPAAMRARQGFEGTGFDFLLSYTEGQPWSEYLALLEDHRVGQNLPDGHVPAAFLAAVVDEELVGRVSIRFQLNEFLASRGGHIGYGVIEEHRRRGFATAILRLALAVAADNGVAVALLTCDDDNVASFRVIERCGGVLEKVAIDDVGVPFRRYWVPTITN